MTVRDMIDRLTDMLENDETTDDSEVIFVSQPSWPFENSITGLCTRADVGNEDGEDEDEDGEETRSDESGEMTPKDVFLVEGSQLRYGSKAAWSVAS